MKCLTVLFGLFIFVGHACVSYATCSGRCYRLYCGPDGSHGYCTDYIKQRTGFKHSGDAKNWPGNISTSEIRVGDVAVFDFGAYGHVAVVEDIDGSYITISEWNWGPCRTGKCDRTCGVTDNYHRITMRRIPISSVTRFWRPANDHTNNPDGGQTWYIGAHVHVIHDDYRCSTKMPNGKNLCWEPGLDPNEEDGRRNCWNANRWYEVKGSVGSVWKNRTKSNRIVSRDRSMCAEVYNDHPGMGGGSSTGGSWQTNPGESEGTYDNDPFVPNADVSIRYLRIKGPGQCYH